MTNVYRYPGSRPFQGTENVYRYPGSRPFQDTEIERRLFCGREREKSDLLNLILAHDLVLLYARSGTGKTSLLNAGVLQDLRAREMFPIVVRFYSDDPVKAVRDEIVRQAGVAGVEIEEPVEGAEDLVALVSKGRFWRIDTLLTPVLIFDQFEELFTLFQKGAQEAVIHSLVDVVARGLPKELEKVLEGVPTIPYKVVFSVREDFFGEMESVADLIPAVMQHRFRLTPLTKAQAELAIREPAALEHEELSDPAFVYTDEAIDTLVSFLSRKRSRHGDIQGDVEPFQLQIICQHIERKAAENLVGSQPQVITSGFFGGEEGIERVIELFYNDQINGLPEEVRETVHSLCEYGLINAAGKRVSLDGESIVAQYGVDAETLKRLVDVRLLRSEPRLESDYYELSHDTLVAAILHTKAARRPDVLLEIAREARANEQFMSAASSYLELTTHFVNARDLAVAEWAKFDEAIAFLIEREYFGDTEKVISDIQASGVASPYVEIALGRLRLATADPQGARDQFSQARAVYPGVALVHFWFGVSTLALADEAPENIRLATDAFQQALSLDATQPGFHVYRLGTLAKLGDTDGISKHCLAYAGDEALIAALPAAVNNWLDGLAVENAADILSTVLKVGAQSVEAVVPAAQKALEMGDYATANTALEMVLDLDPEADIHQLWGLVLQSLEDFDSAEEKFSTAIQRHPEDGDTWLNRAELRLIMEAYEEAIEDCREMLDLGFEPWTAHTIWAKCLRNLGDPAVALSHIEEADQLKPGDSDRLTLWAETLFDIGQEAAAVKKARRAVDADPKSPDALISLAWLLWATNRPAEASERFQSAHELEPERADILLLWGQQLHSMQRYFDAIDKFERANRLDKNDPEILVEWAKALHQANSFMLSMKKCTQALKLDPALGEAHLCRAMNLSMLKRPQEAFEAFEEAARSSPQDAMVEMEWAKALSAQGDDELADQHFRRAAEMQTDDDGRKDVYDYWGHSLGRRQLHGQAEAVFRKALEFREDAYVLIHLAEALVDQSKLDEARGYVSRAEKLIADQEHELGEMGWVFYLLGDLDKSLQYSRRALDLAPDALYTRCNAGLALLMLGRVDEARSEYERAIRSAEKSMDADEFEYHAVQDIEDAIAKAPNLPGGEPLLRFVREHLERIRKIRLESGAGSGAI